MVITYVVYSLFDLLRYPFCLEFAYYLQFADCIYCLANAFKFVVFSPILDIDDCESIPCKNNATCIDGIDEFSCHCSPGYYGDNCTESKDDILIYLHITIGCEKNHLLKMFLNLG